MVFSYRPLFICLLHVSNEKMTLWTVLGYRPGVESKNYVNNTNLKQRMISIKYKLAQKEIQSQKVNQTQTQ